MVWIVGTAGIGGAQVAAGNGVGRAPRNPGKPLAKEAAARKKEKKHLLFEFKTFAIML